MERIGVKKMNNEELMHYGIPGMKWGHRKAQTTSSTYNKVRSTKAAYKQAKKQYSKDFNKAYGYTTRHPISQFVGKKAKAESDRRWDKAYDSADKVNSTKSAYKKAKIERKTQIKNTTNRLNKKASWGEKLMYNEATRKKAAKYIVDNNMSVADATKKAKGEAWRNSAALVGAYAAVTVASLYKATR